MSAYADACERKIFITSGQLLSTSAPPRTSQMSLWFGLRLLLLSLLLSLLLAASIRITRGQNPYISVIAGTGSGGYNGDNIQGTSATLSQPYAVAVDKTNSNLYISSDHRVRRLSLSTGIITTFAGTGTQGSSGDGGAATSASLYYPSGLVLDSSNDYLYISDLYNYVIRRVKMSTNIISLYAGTYGSSGSVNDAATSATFFGVRHIAMDSSNNGRAAGVM